MNAAGVAGIGADDDHLPEFGQHLAAGAARAESVAGGDNGDCLEFAVALADGLSDRDALRAIGQPVAGILNIDARVDLATLRQERRADTEF